MNLDDFKQLRDDALPIDESDWGTERQIDAENVFFDAVQKAIGSDDFDEMCYIIEGSKMDIKEALDFGLNCYAFGLEFMLEKLNLNRTQISRKDFL